MVSDAMIDYRERMERQRLEAEQRREMDRVEQRAMHNTPDARVRIWERLHQLKLPQDASHPILAIIAQQTALSMDELLEVQRIRSSPAA
jgi:hypothetical protein